MSDDVDDHQVTIILPKSRAENLMSLLAAYEMVSNWCKFNRSIGKWVLVFGLTLVVLLSDALSGIKNILSTLGKH
jgi:hypothetical protein